MMKKKSRYSIIEDIAVFSSQIEQNQKSLISYDTDDVNTVLFDLERSAESFEKIKSFYSSITKTSFEEEWYRLVENLAVDLSIKFESKLPDLKERYEFSFISRVFKDLDNVIDDYRKDKLERFYIKTISEKSIKNFLYLFPVFYKYSPSVAIDADSGFINAGFIARDSSLLNALITDTGEIHYSLVGKSKRIFKVSGTAKIKDPQDFKEFKRVMKML